MTPLPKEFTGDHPIVEKLNKILRAIEERTPLRSSTAGIDYLQNGFRVTAEKVARVASGEVEQFLVMSVHRDHLECERVTYNESLSTFMPDGVVVRVAKPESLRQRGWDGTGLGLAGIIDGYRYTYIAGGANPDASQNPYLERTAELVDGSEYGAASIIFTEQVCPTYIAVRGSQNVTPRTIIYAARVKQSPLLTVTETVDGVTSTHEIEWIDLNVDGRMWLPKQRKLRVCVEGSSGPWFVLFRASDSFTEE